MALTRKKYILDKKFQYGLSVKAIFFPLISTIVIFGVLFYFALAGKKAITENNSNLDTIIDNQLTMIDTFLTIPALQETDNPIIESVNENFNNNSGIIKSINANNELMRSNNNVILVILAVMAIIQCFAIFFFFIYISHKISGPLHVMTQKLKELQNGETPVFRPLRKNDELQDFYSELKDTINSICQNIDE